MITADVRIIPQMRFNVVTDIQKSKKPNKSELFAKALIWKWIKSS
jgi:hypothetical protein